jgi:hypothetical protein
MGRENLAFFGISYAADSGGGSSSSNILNQLHRQYDKKGPPPRADPLGRGRATPNQIDQVIHQRQQQQPPPRRGSR